MVPVEGENRNVPGSSRVTGSWHTAHSPIGGSPLFFDCSCGTRYEQPLVAPHDGHAWHEPARCMMSPHT